MAPAIKASVRRLAKRHAAAVQLDLFAGDWQAEDATGRVSSDEWEVEVTIRAATGHAEHLRHLSPIQRRILAAVSDTPMANPAIAEAVGSEEGEYLEKALRALWNEGRLLKHVRGWVKVGAAHRGA